MCSTGERGAWHWLLPGAPVSADCCAFGCPLLFVFHLFLCWDGILDSLRLFCWVMKLPSLGIQSLTVWITKVGKSRVTPHSPWMKQAVKSLLFIVASPVHKGYLSRNSYLVVLNRFSWEGHFFHSWYFYYTQTVCLLDSPDVKFYSLLSNNFNIFLSHCYYGAQQSSQFTGKTLV